MADADSCLLIELPFNQFLDRLGDRNPTPGGGAVAGAVGALCCALGRMVGEYSITKKSSDSDRETVTDIIVRLARAEALMRRLLDEDAEAYGEYSELAAKKETGEEAAKALDSALERAMMVPLGISATAGDVLEIMEELSQKVSRWMFSDLEAAAILAEATVRCAGCSLKVNTVNVRDAEHGQRLVNTLVQIEESAKKRLEAVLASCAAVAQSK